MRLKPRYYQLDALDKIINYICTTSGKHPLVALPTGSGKSLVISMLIEYVRLEWNINVLVLSHTEDILRQDHKSITSLIDEEVGLYSAGLNSKIIRPVTVAGIQSCYKNPELFEHFDFVIIDEAHLINIQDETMYKKFLDRVGQIYCGLTATPFRLGSGYIFGPTSETLFDHLVCDYTEMDKYNKLVEAGFLCPIKAIQTKLEFDTENLKHRMGDFVEKEMSQKFDRDTITDLAIKETIKIAKEHNCKKWLFFAINIEHAEHIAETLIRSGIPTGLIHSKMIFNKETVLEKHRNGTYKALVNVNVLTTGYDDPEIDLIGMLRPTDSPVLHVQMVGREARISPGKEYAVFLDFAGNTKRLGPINNVHVHKKSKNEGTGEPIVKTCPECDTMHHPTVKVCPYCGYKFEFKTRLELESSGYEIIDTGNKWYNITGIQYNIHKGLSKPDSIKVTYITGVRTFSEYWCLDHKGYARMRAVQIMKARGASIDDLSSCQDALDCLESLSVPSRVLVNTSKKYPQLIRYKFD